jgi:hypothetical protein
MPWGSLPLGIPVFRCGNLKVILRCLVRPFIHTHRMLVKQGLMGGTSNKSPPPVYLVVSRYFSTRASHNPRQD